MQVAVGLATGAGVAGVTGAGVGGMTGAGVAGVTGAGVGGATGAGVAGVTGAGVGELPPLLPPPHVQQAWLAVFPSVPVKLPYSAHQPLAA